MGSIRGSHPYPKLLWVLCGNNTIPKAFVGSVKIIIPYVPEFSVGFVKRECRTRNFCEFCTPVEQYVEYGYTLAKIPRVWIYLFSSEIPGVFTAGSRLWPGRGVSGIFYILTSSHTQTKHKIHRHSVFVPNDGHTCKHIGTAVREQ